MVCEFSNVAELLIVHALEEPIFVNVRREMLIVHIMIGFKSEPGSFRGVSDIRIAA